MRMSDRKKSVTSAEAAEAEVKKLTAEEFRVAAKVLRSPLYNDDVAQDLARDCEQRAKDLEREDYLEHLAKRAEEAYRVGDWRDVVSSILSRLTADGRIVSPPMSWPTLFDVPGGVNEVIDDDGDTWLRLPGRWTCDGWDGHQCDTTQPGCDVGHTGLEPFTEIQP